MNATAPARRLPLSRHPAFAPLVALWLAALVGGCMAVLPGQHLLQPPAIVGCAALSGALGWSAARYAAGAQKRRNSRFAERPAAYVERLLVGIDANGREQEHSIEQVQQPEPRHGKAVQLLRQRLPQELAMPLLVERFAVALADYRQPSARGLTEPPRPAGSTDLAFALYALRSELRRAAPGRHDSRFAQRDLGTAAEHGARE